jgi:hypothetical protein
METEDHCTGLRVQHGCPRDENTLKEKSLLVKEPSGIRGSGVADKETATIDTERILQLSHCVLRSLGSSKGGSKCIQRLW